MDIIRNETILTQTKRFMFRSLPSYFISRLERFKQDQSRSYHGGRSFQYLQTTLQAEQSAPGEAERRLTSAICPLYATISYLVV